MSVLGMRYDIANRKIYTEDEFINESLGDLPNEDMLREQFQRLPLVGGQYDSTADTQKHIRRVAQLMTDASTELLRRANVHDDSKLSFPEKSLFDEFTPKLANCTFGSDEYKGYLVELKVALDHHYKHNSHHPEHYANGINDFDLFDLVEMFFDWKAATERTKDGDIYKSIEYNRNRFDMSGQICDIFKNTADRTFKA